MSNQYWFYSYTWRIVGYPEQWNAMNVWDGSFADLVYMIATHEGDKWVLTFAKEITREEFEALYEHME